MSDKNKKYSVVSQVSDLENFTFGTNWTDKESSSKSNRSTKDFTVRSNQKSRLKQKDHNSEQEPIKRRRFRGKEFVKGGESAIAKDSFKPVVNAYLLLK